MDNLRKVYQRAVCIPLNNVEALWKAYDAFESGLNKLTVSNDSWLWVPTDVGRRRRSSWPNDRQLI